MIKLFFTITTLFTVINLAGQNSTNPDYIITISNDTLKGTIKPKNFYEARKISLSANNITQKFKFKQLKEIKVNDEKYLRLSKTMQNKTSHIGLFVKPILYDGNIMVYQHKRRILLRKKNHSFPKRHLKYYANDYSETKPFTKQKNNLDSLVSFVSRYNKFKEHNPSSKSFIEEKLHYKPFFNPQIALYLVGLLPSYSYIGAELGITKKLALSPRFSILNAKKRSNSDPESLRFNEVHIKYYFLNKLLVKREKKTYKYSGFNISTSYMHPYDWDVSKILRYEIGHKVVSFNNIYSDFNIGAIFLIDRRETYPWATFGLGYSF